MRPRPFLLHLTALPDLRAGKRQSQRGTHKKSARTRAVSAIIQGKRNRKVLDGLRPPWYNFNLRGYVPRNLSYRQEGPAVTPDLSTCRKVAGIKQTMRALREHRAEKLYIACDADPAVLEKIEALGREQGLKIDRSATMAQLGHCAGIAVGAAVIAVLRE